MMTDYLKKGWPYLAAILLFITLSLVYFSPVLEGKRLPQMDDTHAKGMAQELNEYQKETGKIAQWTNSMFGGMPAYNIKVDSSFNIFKKINWYIKFGLPYHTAAIVFLYMLGFYVLLLAFRVDKWLSIAGAIAFGFGSYNIIIIIVGHITKAYTIGMMAPVIAGVIYTYNRNRIIGGIFTTLALGLNIASSHVQITYYLALLIGLIVISKFVYALKEKEINGFFKTSVILVGALIIAILPGLPDLLTQKEYSEYSIRGKSELKSEDSPGKQSSGLDKDYAFAWSYAVNETWTLMVPDVVGGASRALGDNEDAQEVIRNVRDQQVQKILAQQFTQYWGGRGFTEGPVYIGAIICFLFLLGAFYYKGNDKWWLIAGTLLSLFLAWGKNMAWFNDFMFYHFPLYNKFRTVEMALVIASVTMPLLGFLGLREIYKKPDLIKNDSKWFLIAFGLTGGISLLFYLMPGTFFRFISNMEYEAILNQKAQMPQYAATFDQLIQSLKEARMAMMKTDAIRSFFFILLASGSLWLFATNKLSSKYLTAGLALLILIDLWGVDKRYLNNDNFISKRKAAETFEKSVADKAILQDKDPYYRVLSIYRDPFKDATTPYYHKSIGGYHGAKMRRYQDLYDRYGYSEVLKLRELLQHGYSEGVDEFLKSATMLNMMNGKYVIFNPGVQPITNPYAMGNAWFVKNVKFVGNANQELDALGIEDLAATAVVDSVFSSVIGNYKVDSVMGSIQLTDYKPDELTFTTSSNQEQLAVFSDVYYPKGWDVFIDGKKSEIIRADYTLRALMIPAGEHTIEFRFEPQTYKTGVIFAYAGSAIVFFLIIGLVFYFWKNREKLNENEQTNES